MSGGSPDTSSADRSYELAVKQFEWEKRMAKKLEKEKAGEEAQQAGVIARQLNINRVGRQALITSVSPKQDFQTFQAEYMKRNPNTELASFMAENKKPKEEDYIRETPYTGAFLTALGKTAPMRVRSAIRTKKFTSDKLAYEAKINKLKSDYEARMRAEYNAQPAFKRREMSNDLVLRRGAELGA